MIRMGRFQKEYDDQSGIDEAAEYRCVEADCRHVSFGSELLPMIYRPSKADDDGSIVDDNSRMPVCHIRRCSYCRGKVALIEPVLAGRCCA
jgi:hypothetical protein